MAINCGVSEDEIRKAALLSQGVRRRFDIRINRPGLVYIDDYAHHPEEIRAFILSVKEYFRGRKITGIFQPHLYSRTRDHAEGFARILDQLDRTILLPVYPARKSRYPGKLGADIRNDEIAVEVDDGMKTYRPGSLHQNRIFFLPSGR